MKRAILYGIVIALIVVVPVLAQYTGFEIEGKKPPELGPRPGPGDVIVVEKLDETNRLLREQNQLITDQNKLLRQLVDRKQKSNP